MDWGLEESSEHLSHRRRSELDEFDLTISFSQEPGGEVLTVWCSDNETILGGLGLYDERIDQFAHCVAIPRHNPQGRRFGHAQQVFPPTGEPDLSILHHDVAVCVLKKLISVGAHHDQRSSSSPKINSVEDFIERPQVEGIEETIDEQN